jgi:hypothetical protein
MGIPRHTGAKLEFPKNSGKNEGESESDTLRGVGRQVCHTMPECQVAFLQALNDRDLRLEHRFDGVERQVSEMRTLLLNWLGSKGLRNADNTPRPPVHAVALPPAEMNGTLNVEAGPIKLRGRPWIIAALAVAAMVLTATAYVLGKWGRPTHDSDTVHQLRETTVSQRPTDAPAVVATQP